MSKTEQSPGCAGRSRVRGAPSRSSWQARKPEGFDQVLESLATGPIEEDKPYLVLMEIEPRDAERRDVRGLCTQLAHAELQRCLDNELGVEIERITWNDMSAFKDLFQIEKRSALKGGTDLVDLLKQDRERDFTGWQFDLVSQYLSDVSERLDIPIQAVRP